jgi:hypothetical protein
MMLLQWTAEVMKMISQHDKRIQIKNLQSQIKWYAMSGHHRSKSEIWAALPVKKSDNNICILQKVHTETLDTVAASTGNMQVSLM